MQEIIAPINRNLIKKELTQEVFVRYTNNGNNEIYLVNHHNAPNTVREIGRLRELTFRAAGGGTGLALDLDDNDTCSDAYDQLIAWNPEDEEIIAGYRLIKCRDVGVNSQGEINLSTAHYFHFSQKFIRDYLPYTIELGRSFVQPKYQPNKDNRKGLFSLDNLWDGLGAVVKLNPDVKYLFGKVTMYPHYNREARDLLIYFMHHYFPDQDRLVWPIRPLGYFGDVSHFRGLFEGLDYKDAYKILNGKVRALGENIPPLINTYMNLSSTMKTFGTAINDEFGTVEETGIMITIDDIFESKKERHISTYERDRTMGSRNVDAPGQ
ncbi:Acetyltransferase (GNAT) domain-containing protein [Parapedobacter composti]|uniref:Acetyltransferase (GNAT) domain-containing protein n=1 Tax=Parapedobacter composti TaxID=623281 RepID=A0A1I1K756_9SPHI|nr:GNAT family N-acetyltransferase [Parapedobacter composti]SFC54568.1 Acetyltransferase (GNAT) domain-containing protein [Parapedobacter composti]